jgi:hypothetical protein
MQLSPRCFAFGCPRTGSRDRLCGCPCPDGYEQAIETEVFAPHHWEGRVSSNGVPIQVSRLGKSSLVRT